MHGKDHDHIHNGDHDHMHLEDHNHDHIHLENHNHDEEDHLHHPLGHLAEDEHTQPEVARLRTDHSSFIQLHNDENVVSKLEEHPDHIHLPNHDHELWEKVKKEGVVKLDDISTTSSSPLVVSQSEEDSTFVK